MSGSATHGVRVAAALLALSLSLAVPREARGQTVEDGSAAALGPEDTRTVLDLVGRHLKRPEAKITVLRRGGDTVICGSVNVKNRDGLYIGERGFVADLASGYVGRVPEGPELLGSSRAEGYAAMDRARQLYFERCLE